MKKQLRKGLSLFLAVMMLMSAWVWVAPEKAAAADSVYSLSVRMQIKEKAEGGSAKLIIKYKPENGTKAETTVERDITNLIKGDNDSSVTFTEDINGFPTSVQGAAKGTQGFTWDNVKFIINGVFINGTQVWGVNDAISGSSGNYYTATGNGGWGKPSWGYSTAAVPTDGLAGTNWPSPYINTLTPAGQISLTAPKFGTNKSQPGSTTFSATDNYGVAWVPSFSLQTKCYVNTESDATSNWNGDYIWASTSGNTVTVTAKEGVQTMEKDSSRSSFYVTVKSQNGKVGNATVNVSNPTYTVRFYPNGGSIGSDKTSSVSGDQYLKVGYDDSTQGGSPKLYYGTKIGEAPAYASRDGMDLIGYFKTPQDPDYSKDGMIVYAEDGTIDVAATQEKNRDKGIFINGETEVDNRGDGQGWYARWQAKPVTVTFKTPDGQTIGTLTGKYNRSLNDTYGSPDAVTAELYNSVKNTASKKYFDNEGNPVYTLASGGSTYNFTGWKIIEPFDLYKGDTGTALTGNVVFEAVFKKAEATTSYNITFYDVDGNPIKVYDKDNNEITEYKYRDNIVMPSPEPEKEKDSTFEYEFRGWAPRVGTKYYVVDSEGYNDDGALISYVSKDTTDFVVRDNAEYVPVFEKIYREYEVVFHYFDDAEDISSKTGVEKTVSAFFHYGDIIVAPTVKDNYTCDGNRYTLTGWPEMGTCTGAGLEFWAVYDSGTPAVYTINFFDRTGTLLNSGENENQYTHNSVVTAPDVPTNDDDGDYHYTFEGWSPVLEPTATKDVDYYAQYSQTPYYNVEFYNGDELVQSEKQLQGETIKTPIDPTKDEDVIGTYTFTGWADAEGNKVTEVTGNTKLYAQYDIVYKNYTVTFKNDDGTELSTATYHYGDPVVVPEATKAADNTFTYAFAGWDTDVAAKCKGDATYTATYKKSYKYYQVQWLNDDGSLYKKENYTYNARILAPTSNPTNILGYGQEDGQYVAFAGWALATYNEADSTYDYALDTNGEKIMYKPGDRIAGNAVYMAVFEIKQEMHTIELYLEDGTTFYNSYAYGHGTPITDKDGNNILLGDGPVSEGDEARGGNHVAFVKWVMLDGTELGANAELTSDLKLKAVYSSEKHNPVLTEVTTPPTFFEEGVGIEECSCGRTWDDTVIPVIPDTVAPTIKTYIGQRSWEFGTTDFGEVFDASPLTTAIFNADDTAERNRYNPLGEGSGVATISYSVQETEVDPEAIAEADWNVRYDYQVNGEDTEANATGRLGNLELTEGKTYILYVKAVDRNGHIAYSRTGEFYYDDVAPVIEVESEHHYKSKYCLNATVKVTDNRDIASITLDGADITNNLTVTAAGLHEVIAVDKGGNITKAVFEIVGKHAYKTYTIAATCEANGSQFERCTLCDDRTEGIAITATGHDFQSYIYTAPTCTENGYKTYVCANGCGKTDIVYDNPATTDEHAYSDWIVDEAATCMKAGSRHKICSKCSDVVTETIPVDTVSGHQWYRPKVIKPTCTDEGYTTRTCRYCGVIDKYNIVPKNGHSKPEDVEWTIVTAPRCDETLTEEERQGKKEKYCAVCGEKIAEEVIPPIDHSYEFYQEIEPTATEEGKLVYKCKYCGKEDIRPGKPQLIEYTVQFKNEDGTLLNAEKTTYYDGESITAADIAEPTKDADNTYRYTFDHWVDEDNNTVTLPITVEKNMTLTAVYTSRYINYTVTLYKEDGLTQYKKVGYQHYGDTLTVENGPNKASDSMYDYNFAGWKESGADDSTASVNISITGDLDLVAAYSKKLREYNVVFAYDAENVIKTVKVQAGSDATDLAPAAADVTKAYDSVYHYTFQKWNTDITSVQKDLYVNPIFTAAVHTGTPSIKQHADCTNPEITTYTCSCGHTNEKETNTALGHDLTDAEHYEDETGYYLICKRCREKILDTTIFSATFLNGDKTVKTVGYLKYGQYLTAEQLPADPTKAEDATYTYTFSHWAFADDDTDTKVDPTTVKITGNVSFKACFTATLKKFTVVFAIDSDHVVKVFKNVEAGTSVTCDVIPEPLTKYDDYGHYVFDGWSRDTTNVSEDLYVTAKFKKVDHTYTTAKTEATCTVGAGTTYTCDCGYHYTVSTGKPLGHNWIVVESKEPTYDDDGYIKYECDRCGETKTEVLPDKDYIFITITLIDQDGAPVQGANVALYDKGTFVVSGDTDQNGKVTLVVEEAKDYTIVISGKNVDTVTADVTVNPDGSIDMSKVPTIHVDKCSCTCHRNGFWPTIFRFFHKIIKMLVGEFKCCNDPDERYYK